MFFTLPSYCVASIDTEIVISSGEIHIHRFYRARQLSRKDALKFAENYKDLTGPSKFLVFTESHGEDEIIQLTSDQFHTVTPHKSFAQIYSEIQQLALNYQAQPQGTKST